LACAAAPRARAQEAFAVVVHPGVPGGQIEKKTLAAVFLKQMTRWSDGSTVKPVDQSARSPVRAAFSQEGLGQSVVSVTNYWGQQIQRGHGPPPPVKTTDAEVLGYVRSTPGAIGYVTAPAAAGAQGVKLVKIIE
jgi:ABC-type phosphate transport system substrate-binding protein